MGNQQAKYQRRNYLIKKGFQTKYILRFFLLFLVCGAISASILYFYVSGELRQLSYRAHIPEIGDVWEIILPTVAMSTVITMVLVGVALLILTRTSSTALTNPLIKFESVVKEVSRGNLGSLQRSGEEGELGQFGEGFYQMADTLKERIGAVKGSVGDLTRVAEKSLPGEGGGEFKEELQKLENEVDFFKV